MGVGEMGHRWEGSSSLCAFSHSLVNHRRAFPKPKQFFNDNYFMIYYFNENCLQQLISIKMCFLPPFFSLQKLKHRARGCSPDIRQIDLDVNRTFRDHIMFRDRYGVK